MTFKKNTLIPYLQPRGSHPFPGSFCSLLVVSLPVIWFLDCITLAVIFTSCSLSIPGWLLLGLLWMSIRALLGAQSPAQNKAPLRQPQTLLSQLCSVPSLCSQLPANLSPSARCCTTDIALPSGASAAPALLSQAGPVWALGMGGGLQLHEAKQGRSPPSFQSNYFQERQTSD